MPRRRDATIRAALRPSVAAAVTVAARVAPAVILLAVAAWEIVVTRGAPGEVPGDAAWGQAAAAVRADHRPGELIVFAPPWVDPVGRMHLGDLIPPDMAGRLDAARYPVIWELSIRGARSPDTAGLRAVSSRSFGGVTVRRFEQAPAEVLADLVALAPKATVRGKRARGPTVELAEVGFAPHRCAQLVPQPGETVTLDFGRLTLGGSIAGGVGLADVFTRRDVRNPGRLALKVDGEVVAERRFGVDDGWVRFAAATTPGEHAVEVELEAVGKGARDRLICFAAEVRR